MQTPPVLFLVFNKPDTTATVLKRLREARPARLYIAADGPRPGNSVDAQACTAVRQLVSNINWDCQLSTRLLDDNLGCRDAVSSAIDWFFENEAEGIIIEDDCLPDITFFSFCAELLQHYREEPRVMHISGYNSLPDPRQADSYHFSHYPQIWGWATWRRAWQHYDLSMSELPELEHDKDFAQGFHTPQDFALWQYLFNQVRSGTVQTWDYSWTYSVRRQGGLCVTPRTPHVRNLGIGHSGAIHSCKGDERRDPNATVQSTAVRFPIKHPEEIVTSRSYDLQFTETGHRAPMRISPSKLLRRRLLAPFMPRYRDKLRLLREIGAIQSALPETTRHHP